MQPLLVIHGINDGSCPYWIAVEFRDEVERTNNNFEFHALDREGHYIWYEQQFTDKSQTGEMTFSKIRI